MINMEKLAENINGTIYGDSKYKTDNLTGVFTTLNDADEGDIVIRHWINGKGVEIANNKKVACLITLHPQEDALDVAKKLNYPVIVVNKIEEANAYALKETLDKFAPNSKRIVITGTNGKSTTSHMIYHILGSTGAKTFTNTDARSEFNTLIDPMVSKLINQEVNKVNNLDYVVIEVSEVQGWDDYFMKGHAKLMSQAINPDIAVITNIAMDHIGLVNSIEEVTEEIQGYVKSLTKGFVIINTDDKNVREMDKINPNTKPFYVSMNKSSLDDFDIDYKLYYDDTRKAIIYQNNVFLKLNELPFQSYHFIQNTLSAIATVISLGIPLEDIKTGVKSYTALKRRFVTLKEKPLIIDDFAHNPDGIKATIKSAYDLANEKNLDNLYVINAIRGSRGVVLNKLIAESLVNVLNMLDLDEMPVNLILSCSEDEVDNLNIVKSEEKEVFTDLLTNNNIDFVLFDKLYDSLEFVLNKSTDNDLILLIGAQGMDPAEKLLKNLNVI